MSVDFTIANQILHKAVSQCSIIGRAEVTEPDSSLLHNTRAID